MKSGSSKCSVESADSDSGLKGRIIRKGNIYPSGGEAGQIVSDVGISPVVKQAKRGGMAAIPLVSLDVSGQTTMTNTPAKSTEKDSATKSLSKGTSRKSPPQIYPTMTSSRLASLVRVFPLRENVEVFKTSQGELFSGKSAESYEIKDHNTYFLRMLRDYFLTTQAEPSRLYSFRWMNLGMTRNGLSQTLSITYRRTVNGSLSSVLEKKVDDKYYLGKKALNRLMNSNFSSQHNLADEISSTLQTPAGGGHIPKVAQALQQDGQLRTGTSWDTNQSQSARNIRRLTPRECERLQGFPDNWTEGVSDTQRYKQMGNAVSVPVIEAIGKKILGII